MRARASLSAMIAVVAILGCKDVGLPDRNLPLEEAAHRPPAALVRADYPELGADTTAHALPTVKADVGVSSDANAVQIREQTFTASGTPVTIPDGALEPIGSSNGGTFHAVKGDEAPYDRLYMMQTGNTYIEFLPVHEHGSPAARNAVLQRKLENRPPGR